MNSKVIAWTSYSEWGEITHNAVLKCGARELDLVKEYATHDFDAVLNMYYAKARMYDADNRRFPAQDPILDPSGYDLKAYITTPMDLNQYLYVRNNAVIWIDPSGEFAITLTAGTALAVIACTTYVAIVNDPHWQALANDIGNDIAKIIYNGKTYVGKARDRLIAQIQAYASYFDKPICKTSGQTAGEIISRDKKGAINREFPAQWRDSTLAEIERAAKRGDKSAQKAKKLLEDKRFDKTDNRK